jgi:hypothetical protein
VRRLVDALPSALAEGAGKPEGSKAAGEKGIPSGEGEVRPPRKRKARKSGASKRKKAKRAKEQETGEDGFGPEEVNNPLEDSEEEEE